MSDRYAPGDSDPRGPVPTFVEVVATIRASRKRAGLPHDVETCRADARAYFARRLAMTPEQRAESEKRAGW